MPTQVQGLITASYTAIVDVSSDTEVLTQAQMTNTAVALGNRIEFLRSLSPEASLTPDKFFYVREDWASGSFDGTSQLRADLNWTGLIAGSPSVSILGGSNKNPGQLRINLPTNSSFAWFLAGRTDSPLSFATFQKVRIVFFCNDNAGNLATSTQIGLCQDSSLPNGGTDCLQITYQRFNANYQVILRKSSAQTVINTGVLVVGLSFVTVDFDRDPITGNVAVSINGSVVTTILAANMALGGCNIGGSSLSTVADAFPFETRVDMIFARGDTGATRSGP